MARQTGTVVVVDDDDSARKALHALLSLHDFTVVEAKNGAEAIAVALDCTPDLILMDIRMPVMDGIEATRRLRAGERTASIPIVAVSGEGFSAGMAMNAEREPLFDRFLMKPVPVAQLLRIVQAYAGGAAAHTARDGGRGGSTTGEKAQEGASSARTPPREPRD